MGDFFQQTLALIEVNWRDTVTPALARAATLFAEGMTRGCYRCQALYGLMRYEGWGCTQDVAEGVRLVQVVAGMDQPWGLFALARCYQRGIVVSLDIDRAFSLYCQSAGPGNNPMAQCNLGFAYIHGMGTTKDVAAGVACYRAAAGQGSAQAMFNLGVCYRDGTLEQDCEKKCFWLHKASELTHAQVSNQLLPSCPPILSLVFCTHLFFAIHRRCVTWE